MFCILSARGMCSCTFMGSDCSGPAGQTKSFQNGHAKCYDIEAVEADEFLVRTFDLYTAKAITILHKLKEYYSKPAFTLLEFVLDLTAKGLSKLAARVRANHCFL